MRVLGLIGFQVFFRFRAGFGCQGFGFRVFGDFRVDGVPGLGA